MSELYVRSEGKHESGAFMLGEIHGTRRRVTQVVFYDDLDTRAYDSGVCILTGESFGPLWQLCRKTGLNVVADIHTHPGQAFQSDSDRTNPMVAQLGHIALIAPNFGRGDLGPADLTVYQYLGGYEWTDYTHRAERFFYVGFWG